MNKSQYEERLDNTINHYLSEYNLQKIINILRENNIAAYKNNSEDNENFAEDGTVIIESKKTKYERIAKCLDLKKETYYEIEKYMINKSYRYSIYFKCENFNIDNISTNNEFININEFKKYSDGLNIDYLKTRYMENEEQIFFAFYKIISYYVQDIDRSMPVLYPSLWIYHKKLGILEHRFDYLGFRHDDNFYKITFEAQLYSLKLNFRIICDEFRTTDIIKYIASSKKNEVHELSQYVGLKGNSSAKLKVGENMIMPFIGDIELLLEEHEELFNSNKETKKIKEIFNIYIKTTKKNANYKSILLSWDSQEEKAFLNINVMFSYKNNNYDVFNFLHPQKNDMEMMNYAIQYICQVKDSMPRT